MSRLVRLYPAAWRDRYEAEFVDLLEDRPPSLADRFDIVRAALDAHLRPQVLGLRTGAEPASFAPTRWMRWFGLLGLVGGALLLAAFLTFEPFAERWANLVRLVVFTLGGAGVAAAFYPRQALAAPTTALISSAAVIVAGLGYAGWLIVANWVPSPFSGPFGYLNLWASAALWLSAAIYGVAMLRSGAAWRGMPRLMGVLTRLGAFVLLGSSVAWIGDDRFGWVDSAQYGGIVQAVAMTGVFLNGLGWILLGTVLVFGGRSAQTARG